MPATFVKRTVSPLRFDSLRADPDDVLCPGSDAEDTLEGHEAKRRRVEQAGEDYLRGKPLYIASARLKGPFVSGWNIPTRKRRPEKANEARGRVSRQGSAIDSLKLKRAPGHQDFPIDISSHETESFLLTPATHSRRGSTTEQIIIHQSAPKHPQRLPTKNGKRITRHFPSPTASTSPDRTEQLDRVRPSLPPERDRLKSATGNEESPTRRSVSSEAAQINRGLLEAKKLSKAAIVRARESGSVVNEPPIAPPDRPDVVSGVPFGVRIKSERSPHALPPSTNLPGFEYRRRSREVSRTPERRSFKEDLEAAKKKARAEKRWRLSFTASGSVKNRNPQESSDRPQASQFAEHSSEEIAKPIHESILQQHRGTKTRRIEVLPEAQVVQDPAFKVPSGLSTGILETDKLPIQDPRTEDGDSYLGLSTQAAMWKAQDTFQNDLVSSTNSRLDPTLPGHQNERDHDAVDDRDRNFVEPDHTAPNTRFQTPQKENEPTSTQAMIDAMSPFARTTSQKRPALDRRSSSTPSGSAPSSLSPAAPNFDNTSLSMSTSPSPTPTTKQPPVPLSALSKPASSVTSFSIAPNGTMTEVFQQDRQLPPDYVMGDMDLNAAIEEAGSFLGEWNLEKEARNQGQSTGSKGSTAKASRSH
ncbi:MAG: hypothetical protein Q9169_002892 [Polycauliona sp. 2 TL-2023]